MKNIKIAASLVCADPLNLEKEVNELIESKVDLIHFDVMDGSFVPRYGLYPEILKAIKAKENCPPVDVHLMVENPEDFIEIFALNGADYFSFHIEACKHPHRVIKKIQNYDLKPGIALNPNTSIDTLKWMIQDIKIVVLMTINPGIVGHKFIPEMYKKISELRNFANLNGNTDLIIEIDGGVTPKNIKPLIEAGADALVCGNGTIFRPHEDSITNKVNGLKSYIDEI